MNDFITFSSLPNISMSKKGEDSSFDRLFGQFLSNVIFLYKYKVLFRWIAPFEFIWDAQSIDNNFT